MAFELRIVREETVKQFVPSEIRKRVRKYTLETFIEKAIEIHGDEFDYSLVTSDHINNGKKSYIQIQHKLCGHMWECSIHNHIIHKQKCPECNNTKPRFRWNYDRLINESKKIHGDNYVYHVKPDDKIMIDSHIRTTCKKCGYDWNPTIDNHIGSGSGCPQCAGNAPWNYERLIRKAVEIHGNIYDYSMVPLDITGAFTLMTLICKLCHYTWTVSIDNHINAKSGCPRCVNLAQWTYKEFISVAKQIHKDRYNYSEVHPDHITSCKVALPVKCNRCCNRWYTDITHHITRKQGCPICKSSHGEIACFDILTEMKISFKSQYSIKSLPDRRYDFMFVHNTIPYILEFDGMQHFQFKELFHHNYQGFLEKQSIDVMKTQAAINEGYRVLRIDYTQIDNIKYHIENGLSSSTVIYFSNAEMYQYISSRLTLPKLLSLVIKQ